MSEPAEFGERRAQGSAQERLWTAVKVAHAGHGWRVGTALTPGPRAERWTEPLMIQEGAPGTALQKWLFISPVAAALVCVVGGGKGIN